MAKRVNVSLDKLKPHPQNPNTHPKKQLDELQKSLSQFGQVKNIVIWNDYILAGHGLVESAMQSDKVELEAIDVSEWDEQKAISYMLVDNRLSSMAIIDQKALLNTLAVIEVPTNIPGFDEDFLKTIGFIEPVATGGDSEPQVDRAEELQEKWQCKSGQMWQLKSVTNPGYYHRLICGDCRDKETVELLTEDRKVNGVFTSPPYAMQRAKQYGGIPTGEYVDWWESVQENVRGILAEDGSFFVNIKPHCENGERVLYVFDLVLAMKRRWGWLFIEEYCWLRNPTPKQVIKHFKQGFEPIYQFSIVENFKFNPDDVRHYSDNVPIPGGDGVGNTNWASRQGNEWALKNIKGLTKGLAYPSTVIDFSKGGAQIDGHNAAFPLKLPTFFIKAYSDPLDLWLDPFCGSGTTILAAENEGRLGYGVEKLEKYCAVILERYLNHTGQKPELIESNG